MGSSVSIFLQKADLDPLAESLLISLANHLDIWFHSDSVAIVFLIFLKHFLRTPKMPIMSVE